MKMYNQDTRDATVRLHTISSIYAKWDVLSFNPIDFNF